MGMVDEFMTTPGPKRMFFYNKMLYPQYKHQFNERVISSYTWKWLQDEAKKNLEESNNASENVVSHWQSIVDGIIPFGYSIDDDC